MYRTIAIMLIVTGLNILACTGYHWRYEFLPDESHQQTDLYGWRFEPEIDAYKWLPRGEDSTIARYQRFWVGFQFEIPNKEEVDSFYDIQLDNVIVSYFSTENTDTLVVRDSWFWGYDKSINKKFSLAPQTPTATTSPSKFKLFIPLGVDSIRLSFDAILRAGERTEFFTELLPTIPHDSIAVFDDAQPFSVPVSVILYRRLDKLGTTIGLMDRNLNKNR